MSCIINKQVLHRTVINSLKYTTEYIESASVLLEAKLKVGNVMFQLVLFFIIFANSFLKAGVKVIPK